MGACVCIYHIIISKTVTMLEANHYQVVFLCENEKFVCVISCVKNEFSNIINPVCFGMGG